jgi:hypothetical protein
MVKELIQKNHPCKKSKSNESGVCPVFRGIAHMRYFRCDTAKSPQKCKRGENYSAPFALPCARNLIISLFLFNKQNTSIA